MYKRLFRMIFAVLGAAIGVGCFTVLKLNVLIWLGDFSAVKRGLIAGGFGLVIVSTCRQAHFKNFYNNRR